MTSGVKSKYLSLLLSNSSTSTDSVRRKIFRNDETQEAREIISKVSDRNFFTREGEENTIPVIEAALRSVQSGAPVFSKSDILENKDLITAENILIDPDTKERLSSMLALDLILQTSKIDHPKVRLFPKDGDDTGCILKLSDLEKTNMIPSNSLIETDHMITSASLGKEGREILQKTFDFGFDPLSEILKCCSTAHTVIYSMLFSLLALLKRRIKTWGAQKLDKGEGNELTFYRALEICQELLGVLKESKKITSISESMKRLSNSSSSACSFCGVKSHTKTPIIESFKRNTREYDNKQVNAEISKRKQKYYSNTPPEMNTRSSTTSFINHENIKSKNEMLYSCSSFNPFGFCSSPLAQPSLPPSISSSNKGKCVASISPSSSSIFAALDGARNRYMMKSILDSTKEINEKEPNAIINENNKDVTVLVQDNTNNIQPTHSFSAPAEQLLSVADQMIEMTRIDLPMSPLRDSSNVAKQKYEEVINPPLERLTDPIPEEPQSLLTMEEGENETHDERKRQLLPQQQQLDVNTRLAPSAKTLNKITQNTQAYEAAGLLPSLQFIKERDSKNIKNMNIYAGNYKKKSIRF